MCNFKKGIFIMKNLSNIKSALAVSMLLSASLFSSHCGCPSKLADEILSKDARANVGGRASLAPQYQAKEESNPKKSIILDGREKGIIFIGGRSITIETGEEGIVVQGGLDRAVYENETAARRWSEIRGREDQFYAVTEQYDILMERENFSSKKCLNAVAEAHIRGAVYVSSDSNVKRLLAESDNSKLAHRIGVRYVEGQNALLTAQNEEAKELTKAIISNKRRLAESIANTSENEEFIRLAGVKYTVKKSTKTKCGGLVIEQERSGPSRPQYEKLFEAIKSSDDQNAVAYLDSVKRIESLQAQSAELALRISQTTAKIQAEEKSNVELESKAKTAKKSFVESLRTTTDERLYALNSVMHKVERVDNDRAKHHPLSTEELTQRQNAARAELQFHVRDLKHVGVERTVEERFAASNREFRQETFKKNDVLTYFMRNSDDAGLRRAFFASDLARLQAKGKGAVIELDYRINELQSDLEAHEASDAKVHAEMGKKAPAAPQGLFARLCFWK